MAYGNVKQIRRSVAHALERIEATSGSPSEFVRMLQGPSVPKQAHRAMQGWIHRFNTGPDLVVLMRLLARSWKLHGSLGAHFVSYLENDAETISAALDRLLGEWKAWTKSETYRRKSFDYFLTSPEDGSCCKRWCMFLRWMGRKDELDPGLWTAQGSLAHTFPKGKSLKSNQLVIPLDTHTGRISQYLGLTERKSLGWKAALEVTRALKLADSSDPTRFDFALARLGILDLCKRQYRREICEKCMLLPACRFAQSPLI
jgi:uncharacterized protein (TIGR02757 family)